MYIRKILIISIIIIVLSIFYLSFDVYESYQVSINNYDDINNYINNKDKTKLEGVLEIPTINLKAGIVRNVDDGIIFVNEKLIAGHSGNCKVCYFDNLDNLTVGDNVYLYLDSVVEYKVESIKEMDKNHVYINSDLSLITCKKSDKNRRLLIGLRKIR